MRKSVVIACALTALLALGLAGYIWLRPHNPWEPGQVACKLPDDRASAHPGMVWVPPGTLTLGDTVYAEEGPVQQTAVKGFWMDRTEVSNAEFAAFVKATGYVTVAERPVDLQRWPNLPPAMQQPGAVVFVMPETVKNTDDVRQWWQYRAGANWRHPGGPGTSIEGLDALPVVGLTYEDAQAWATWKGRELPTEAEWEWAAQGGGQPEPGKTLQPPGANTWQGPFPLVNQSTDGFAGVAPVGCYAPNGYGLYDMIGNVWELTRDVFKPNHSAPGQPDPDQAPVIRPPQNGESQQHVIKGGSYLCATNYCMRYRSGARQGQDDDLATSHLGFRTVLRSPGPGL